MKNLRVHPSPTLQGTLQVPGDKSISHRAVMLSALSEGTSTLRGLLFGEDVLATIACFQEMGVLIERKAGTLIIHGVGLHGLKPPSKVLYCGNSGTTQRLLMGILAGQAFSSSLTGDSSLNRRPMERVTTPLRQMGAQIEERRNSSAQRLIEITGRPLKGIRYSLPVASAQVKSAILLAGLYAQGETELWEPVASRNHTELMLLGKGAALDVEEGRLTLGSTPKLAAMDWDIPGDISSAAFFLVAGVLGKENEIQLTGVGINPTRMGILEVLEDMGGKVEALHSRLLGGEAVADLRVRSSRLKGVDIGGKLIPRLIDEIPILAVAAAAAVGKTRVSGAAELRVKESDRIAAIERELAKCGTKVQGLPDGFEVEGPTSYQAGTFESGGDHRIAMSMAIAATQAEAPSTILDVECVDTSYPEFFAHLQKLGGKWEITT